MIVRFFSEKVKDFKRTVEAIKKKAKHDAELFELVSNINEEAQGIRRCYYCRKKMRIGEPSGSLDISIGNGIGICNKCKWW